MKTLITASQLPMAESVTINIIGIPPLVLMERAALAISQHIRACFPAKAGRNVLAVCGFGNNGADGIAACRVLSAEGLRCRILMLGNPDKIREECKTQRAIAERLALPVTIIDLRETGAERRLQQFLAEEPEDGVLLDALFGIGLNRKLSPQWNSALKLLKTFSEQKNYAIVAADIPSGLNATSGMAEGEVLTADSTVTFEWAKTGLYLCGADSFCGKIHIEKAGIYPPRRRSGEEIMALEAEDSLLPARPAGGNKGVFGKVLCICGSSDMGGAAIMSARAALKSGAGMVKVSTMCDSLSNTAVKEKLLLENPEIMYESVYTAGAIDWEKIEQSLKWCSIVLLGCGLSTTADAQKLTAYVMEHAKGTLLLDADGLNCLADRKELLLLRKKNGKSTILTPHPGEFKRLFQDEEGYAAHDKPWQNPAFCKAMADKYGILLVAKDAHTLTTDGNQIYMNLSGNCGMATAGSGDVLAGMLAGILAPQDIPKDVLHAACAVYLHGKCGNLARESLGEYYMTAGDIIAEIPRALESSGY